MNNKNNNTTTINIYVVKKNDNRALHKHFYNNDIDNNSDNN